MHSNLGQGLQSAVENVQVGGNFTIGNITQVVRQRILAKPTGTPQNIPYSGAAQFVGRSQELEVLHQQLQRTDRVAISAISGMGGVGKTELAIQYATQYTEFYLGGVCWLKARASSLSNQILEFAQLHLGLFVPQELGANPLSLEQQVDWCWQHWRPAGQVLVILDDVVDLASLREILPPANRFRLLLTTRQRRLDPSFFELSLDVFSPEAALELLTALIGESRAEGDRATTESLCEWLGYLPLGLELVGRYLAEDPDLPLTQLLERLQIQRLQAEAIDISDSQKQTSFSLMTAQGSVRAAFELSWQELDPAVAAVAQLLSLFALDAIPWKLVHSTAQSLNWSEETLDNARKQLYKRHLLQPAGEGCYKVHPLIREFLQTKLTESGREPNLKSAFAKSMADIAQQVPKLPNLEQLQEFIPVVPHIARAAQSMTGYLGDSNLCQPFIGLARFYEAQGLYEQAEPWRQQCLSETQTRFGIEHTSVADSLHGLARLYWYQGHYSEAEPLFNQALELRKSLLGDNHPDVAESLNDLGATYFGQGDYGKAEPLNKQALELRKSLLGDNHLDVAESLNGVGSIYLFQGHYFNAELSFKEALEIQRNLHGEKHSSVALTLLNLAAFYGTLKNYNKAETLGKQALEINQSFLGDNNPGLVSSLALLAAICNSQGKSQEAETLCKKALELAQLYLGDSHPRTIECKQILASIYTTNGYYSEAESLCKQALEFHQNLYGEEHLIVISGMTLLASIYKCLGRYDEAETLYRKVLEIKKELLGNNRLDVAGILNNLALIYFSQERYSEAESLHKKALKIRKNSLGDKHPNVAESLNNLGVIYLLKERYSDAESLLKQALKINRSSYREIHPKVALNLVNLSDIYGKQKNYNKAETLCRQALEINQKILVEYHPDLLSNLLKLATFCNAKRKSKEAETLCKQALELTQLHLGENHPRIAEGKYILALIYYARGYYRKAISLCQQAIELFQDSLGEEHSYVIICISFLAPLYTERLQFSKAETLYRKVLEANQRLLGGNDSRVASILSTRVAKTLSTIGWFYVFSGRYRKARLHFKQALELTERLERANLNEIKHYQGSLNLLNFKEIGLGYLLGLLAWTIGSIYLPLIWLLVFMGLIQLLSVSVGQFCILGAVLAFFTWLLSHFGLGWFSISLQLLVVFITIRGFWVELKVLGLLMRKYFSRLLWSFRSR